MKKLLLIFSVLFLISCTNKNTIIKIPVYTPPKFEMPLRPNLSCNGNGSLDDVSKQIEYDMIEMQLYAKKLENILNSLSDVSKQ